MLRPRESDIVQGCRGMLQNAAELSMGQDGGDVARVTATLLRASRAELDRIAQREGVSAAWIVRRAVDQYIKQLSDTSSLPFGRGSNA